VPGLCRIAGPAGWEPVLVLPDLADRFDAARARAHLQTLCAPEMEGRWPGSSGERRARDYLQAELRSLGARPLPGWTDYFDPFDVVVPEFRALPTLSVGGVGGERIFEYLEEFGVNVQGAAGAGSAHAETVWLGSPPLESGAGAVSGRVVVVRAEPPLPQAGIGRALKAYLEVHRRLRDAGALAILRVGHTRGVRKVMNHLREEPPLPSLDVTPEVVRAAFGRDPPGAVGTVGRRVRLDVPLVHRTVSSAGNVMACLGTGAAQLLLMAHYDHLGKLPDGRYFAGASDNAAGVAVVLEAARALAPPARATGYQIIVLLTTAEEVGLAGAERYVRQHVDCVSGLEAVVNVDEVGGSRRDGMVWLCASDFPRSRLPVCDGRTESPPVRVRPLPLDGFSDLSPFVAAGMTRVAAVFARSRQGQLAHTLRDTPERIESEQLEAVGRSVLRAVSCSAV
jgi:aminopeptidase YwaD